MLAEKNLTSRKYCAYVAVDHVPEAKHRNWVNEDWYILAVDEGQAREKIAAIAKRRNWWVHIVFIGLVN